MNTLRKEDLLLEQPTIEEQKELQAIFEELEVTLEKRVWDILLGGSGAGGWNWGSGPGGNSQSSCSGCKK